MAVPAVRLVRPGAAAALPAGLGSVERAPNAVSRINERNAGMSDGRGMDWPAQKRESIGELLSTLGKVGFFVQLALLVAPILLAVYVLLLGRSHQGSGTGIDFGSYISFGSLLVMIFTTYWFFRYIKLGQRMKDPSRHPAKSTVLTTLWIGLWAGCLGIAFSMLLLLGAAWRILFVLLTNPQSGMLIAPTAGTNPTYTLSAIDAVSLTLLIISLGAELMVLGLSLWLLFRITWPTKAEAETEMSA
jgi:multisubunit Na+/H+ antiporter MnhG subunit